jgi:hypothetical protein
MYVVLFGYPVANNVFVYLQIMWETYFAGYINGHEYESGATLSDYMTQTKINPLTPNDL